MILKRKSQKSHCRKRGSKAPIYRIGVQVTADTGSKTYRKSPRRKKRR